jgi:hypothetical protein
VKNNRNRNGALLRQRRKRRIPLPPPNLPSLPGRRSIPKPALCVTTEDADGPAVIELNIHPAKLSDPNLATESDGALFWKITTGKKPMPTFGKRFSETDRWNLVNYIRTLPKR